MSTPPHIAIAVALSIAAGSAQPAPQSCLGAIDEVLAQVNALRAEGADCGARGRFGPAPLLAWNDALQAMAQAQADALHTTHDLRHTGPSGQTIAQRAQAAGYRFARVAENLAQGQRTLGEALRGWVGSQTHCANLFGAGFVDAALACRAAADGRALWVMVLARPR